MERKCVYRRAKKEDAAVLAMKIRESDYRELQAVHGIDVDVKKVVEQAISMSVESIVAETLDGELVLIFGVSIFNKEQNVGCPWLLGSNKVSKLARELLKDGTAISREWASQYTYLINFVDARNVTSIRWLKRLGYRVHNPIQFGVTQIPFHPFTMMGGS